MKIWNAPAMQELDVKLTAKLPYDQEIHVEFTDCGILDAGFNSSGTIS